MSQIKRGLMDGGNYFDSYEEQINHVKTSAQCCGFSVVADIRNGKILHQARNAVVSRRWLKSNSELAPFNCLKWLKFYAKA